MVDADLEKAIDTVGRERVFAMARARGWPAGEKLPKYVWWVIVNQLRILDKESGQNPVDNRGQ